MSPLLIQGGIVLVGILAYSTLTAIGHDGTPVLTAALSWGGGAATAAGIAKANGH